MRRRAQGLYLLTAVFVATGFDGPAVSQVSPHHRGFSAMAHAPRVMGRSIAQPNRARGLDAYASLPIYFEPNRGQSSSEVRFLARTRGYDLFLTDTGAAIALKSAHARPETKALGAIRGRTPKPIDATVLRLRLVGARKPPEISGAEPLRGTVNYFLGRDPAQWRTRVPTYAKVRYRDVYPGVDLVYYGTRQGLEYDVVVAPGVDPGIVRLEFGGSDKLSLNARGDVVVHTGGGSLVQLRPKVYQEIHGIRRELSGDYVIRGDHQVGFRVAQYDRTRPLVIDPVLIYSMYLGGGGDNSGIGGLALDAAGYVYVSGVTPSSDFPTVNAVQPTYAGNTDAFVTKLDPTGALVYSTYLGGSGADGSQRIAVDGAGNAYVTGNTASADFPTVNAFQTAYAGKEDAFLTKLDPSGSALAYSTYLGGNDWDRPLGIAVDTSGNAYVTGVTQSADFPVVNAFRSTYGGGCCERAFVTKFDPAGAALVYSTYLGGTGSDVSTDIAVDGAGNAYVTGNTTSADFPTAHAFQPTFGGGDCTACGDAFVTKLDPSGTTLVYSTYLGGRRDDTGSGIAVDAAGNAYVSGSTRSTDFPTRNAFQPTFNGSGCEFCGDAFIAKLNPTGTALVYSTYLGGSGDDFGGRVAVDATGNAYVTGGTSSANFPAVNSFGPFTSQHYTTFVTELAPSGTALVYSTALPDGGTNIAVDTLRDIYVVGSTGGAFVAKIGPASTGADLALTGIVSPNPVQTGDQFTYTVVVTNNGPDDALDVTVSTSASSHAVSFISASPTQGACQGVTCALGTVPSGGAATVAVVGAAGAGGTFTLTSLVSSGVGDPNVANNVAKVGLTAIAHAGGYIFTTIDVPGAIGSTDANGINSGGSVVGEYTDAGGTLHGFLLRNGVFTFINAPKAVGTVTGGINDRGQIVGSEFGSTTSKAFLRLPQAPRLFIPFGARWSPITFAFGISAKAKIVGGFLNPSRTLFHGFLLSQGRLTHIDVAGSPTGSVAFGVNDSAQVVGSYGNLFGGQRHGFLWYNGHVTSIDVPGASSTSANGINEGGQIVGSFSDARGTHGFILDQGAFTPIDIPGASTNIQGINAVGDIVGIMTDGAGDHGFVGWKQ